MKTGTMKIGSRKAGRQATDKTHPPPPPHSRVSLSSYRMKFVWPESIQGLGQQAGKLNLKLNCTFVG